MSESEYLAHDATGLAELVRARKASPAELLAEAKKIQARVNPKINAVVLPTESLEANSPRETSAPTSSEAPFTGVPFLFKDMLDIEGTPMSYASAIMKDYVCFQTHELARRVLDTGLVSFGRTNMSELGLIPFTEPALYGPTKNPWDTSRSPGGSSGGSAAAIAAGIVPMAYAADGGGSIRIPASCCGLFGLKPSRGRNPQESYDDPDGFIVHHCISRSVRDSARLLDATQGARQEDRWHLPPNEDQFSSAIERDPKPMRIAFSTRTWMGKAAGTDAVESVHKTAALCESLGHHVEESGPDIDGKSFFDAFKSLWAMGVGFFFKEAARQAKTDSSIPLLVRGALSSQRLFRVAAGVPGAGGNGLSLLEPVTRKLVSQIESKQSPGDIWMAWHRMREAEVKLARFLQKFDLFLTPTLGTEPAYIGSFDQRWSIEEMEQYLFDYAGYTPLANSGGFPAMSVPMYWNARGLPMGSHFVAGLGLEAKLFQLAAQLERAAPWAQKRPTGFPA